MEIHAVTADSFDDLAALFEARGGPSFCWCRVWRANLPGMNDGTAAQKRLVRKKAMQAEVSAGVHVGLIAYEDSQPVGWVSCGPKESFARLRGGADPVQQAVWSIVCFFVPRPHRRRGISNALIAASIDAASAAGADLIEAMPVDEDSPSYRFMGFIPVFEGVGFQHCGAVGTRRQAMQLRLSGD